MIEGLVAPRHLAGRERILDDKITVQIEQVFLNFGHGFSCSPASIEVTDHCRFIRSKGTYLAIASQRLLCSASIVAALSTGKIVSQD